MVFSVNKPQLNISVTTTEAAVLQERLRDSCYHHMNRCFGQQRIFRPPQKVMKSKLVFYYPGFKWGHL